MRRLLRFVVLTASVAALVGWPPSIAFAQRHPTEHVDGHPPVRHGSVVFIGGYFYDPFFGPYPWWPRTAYPFPYYPWYDSRAVLRVIATPEDAAVYIDGFYGGIVDDFNGFFEGLPLPPGGHTIVLYRDGYPTIQRRVYLAPGSTFKLHKVMVRLPEGEASEPPTLAPPLPPAPEGSYIPPRTAPRTPPPPGTTAESNTTIGTLSLRVQPAHAEVWIDGEPWVSSDGGRFVIQLPAGPHRLDVISEGYRRYSSEIRVPDGETLPLNVSLAPEGP